MQTRHHLLALVSFLSFVSGCACDGAANMDGGTGGGDVVTGGGTSGGGQGGGATGGGFANGGGSSLGGGSATGGGGACPNTHPECVSASMVVCNSDGSNRLGTCVDVGGGCLELQNLTSCGPHRSCVSGATACSCDVDPACPAGAGTSCSGNNTIVCAPDSNSCVVPSSVACAAPKACTGTAPGASCTCPAAGTTVGSGCAQLGATACESGNTESLLTCVSSGGCSVWEETTNCLSMSLSCGTKSGTPSCECPANPGATYFADPVNGTDAGSGPFPTGVATPTRCSFRTLTDALVASATNPNPVTITATRFGSAPVVFDAETFPLVVRPQVTLTTVGGPVDADNFVINYNAPTAPQAFTMRANSAVVGFTLQNINVVSGTGIQVDCPGTTGAARIEGVVIAATASGGGGLNTAVAAAQACDVQIVTSTIRGAGVSFFPNSPTATLTMSASTIEASRFSGLQMGFGSVSLTGTQIRNSTQHGIDFAPMGFAVGQLSLNGAVVEGNAGNGINALVGISGSNITVASSQVRQNGTPLNPGDPAGSGISVTGPVRLTLNSSNVANNAGSGVVATQGAIVAAPQGSTFNNNGQSQAESAGISVSSTGTSFTASGLVLSGNRGNGLRVSSNAFATLTDMTITGNGIAFLSTDHRGAVEVEAASLTLNVSGMGGGSISNNARHGIRLYSGTLTLAGNSTPLAVASNGQNGARIDSAGFNAINVSFQNNILAGVEVTNTAGQPITISDSTFSGNLGAGLLVNASAGQPPGIPSLTVTNNRFTSNRSGIQVVATGPVRGVFQNNTITRSTDIGVRAVGTSASSHSWNGNTITDNQVVTLTGGQNVGGVVFSGTPPSSFLFNSNRIHHNAGTQLAALALSGASTSWSFDATSAASCNPNTANTFACYGGTPAPSTSVGVMAIGAGVTVQARGNAWQNAAPASMVDYLGVSGVVTAPAAVCAASTFACP